MIIERIEIESFAAIKGLTLDFSDGLNLIEGSNESGKSSIADFIKFMLYGVGGKGTDGHLPERKRAINYLESHAGGSMYVRVGERRIRISRNLAVSGSRETQRKTCSVRDTDTGAELYDGREPGELLLGIGESVFVRSAYLKQGGDSQIDGGDVHSAILNILFSGDERMSVEKAVERIDTARKPLAHKTGSRGRIFELRDEITRLRGELEDAVESNAQIMTLSSSVAEKQRINAEHTAKYRQLRARKRAYECAKIKESFALLSRAEAQKISTEMEMLEFKAIAHIPTEAEMDELRGYEVSIKTFEASLSDTQAQRKRLEEDAGRLNIQKSLVSALEREGSASALLSRVEREGKSALRLLVFSVVCALLGAVCGGAAFIIKGLTLPLAAAAAVAMAGFVTLISLSASKRAGQRATLSECECESAEQLSSAIDRYEHSKLRMQILEESLAENTKKTAECKSFLEAERERLREFLLDMNIESADMPFSEISEHLKERSRRSAELEGNAQRALAYYNGLLSQTENYDIEKTEEELRELGISDPLDCDIEKTVERMNFYREQSSILTEKIHEQELALAELRAKAQAPSPIREKLSECTRELDAAERKLDAYMLAAESLKQAAQELRLGVAPALAKAAGEYMSTLTDGKYGALSLDSSFTLTYEAHGEGRHLDYMSTGTQDSAYLCLRLALADMISKQGSLPIILDEATAHMDDTRAAALLTLLSDRSKASSQHILFTCHGREELLLCKLLCEHKYIKL